MIIQNFVKSVKISKKISYLFPFGDEKCTELKEKMGLNITDTKTINYEE